MKMCPSVQKTTEHVILKYKPFTLRSLCEEYNLVPPTDLGLDSNTGWSPKRDRGFGALLVPGNIAPPPAVAWAGGKISS